MFRTNVAALIRCQGKYLACQRSDHKNWQNVQGGVESTDRSLQSAIVRETQEELGVNANDFKVISKSKMWRRYYFPKEILKKQRFENNIGQEQMWFLIELKSISSINLEKSSGEFQKVKLLTIEEFISVYSPWKLPAFYDYCREISIVLK